MSGKEIESKLNSNIGSIDQSNETNSMKDIEFIINRIAVDTSNKLLSNYEDEVDKLYNMKSYHTKAVTLLNNHLSMFIFWFIYQLFN